MAPPAKIIDDFRDLTLSERSEHMSNIFSRFGERICDNNKRVLTRMLDLIAKADDNEQILLNVLATHLQKDTPEVLFYNKWPSDIGEWRGVTRLSDFMSLTGSGSEMGVSQWGRTDTCPLFAGHLEGLEEAVRSNASRDYLGTAAENLKLPAEYCELVHHTTGIY